MNNREAILIMEAAGIEFLLQAIVINGDYEFGCCLVPLKVPHKLLVVLGILRTNCFLLPMG